MTRSSPGKAQVSIVKIWIFSIACACPWGYFSKVNYLEYNGEDLEEASWCSVSHTEENWVSLYLMLGSTIIYYLLPLVTVTVLYTRLFILMFTKCGDEDGGEDGG